MGDSVRYLMEEMVPELEELEERGYFSKAELRQVAQRRESFEYLLKRRRPLKEDYLRYIQHESKLEKLRIARKKSRGIKGSQGVAEYGIKRRIHFIYERALRKFGGDIALWRAWLDYCRASHSHKRTSRVIMKALSLHPNKPALWIYAAAWEFETNRNTAAARSLMHHGLRNCPQELQMWAEYLRMELLYALKLKMRRKVLGLSTRGASDAPADADTDPDAESQLLEGALGAVVARNAMKAAPHSVELRRRLLAVLQPFVARLDQAEDVADAVYADLADCFPKNAAAWVLRATRFHDQPLSDAAFRRVCAAFDEGVEAVGSPQMAEEYVRYLQLQLQPGSGERAGVSSAEVARQLQQVCRTACARGLASESVLLTWSAMALRGGDLQAAVDCASTSAEACGSPRLLQQQLCLQALHAAVQTSSTDAAPGTGSQLSAAASAALAAPQVDRGGDRTLLWLTALQQLLAARRPLVGLLEALVQKCAGSAAGPLRGGMGAVAAAVVQALHLVKGLDEARAAVAKLAAGPSPGGSFWQAAVAMEMAQLSEDHDAPQQARVWQLLEAAVDAHGGEDTQLWLQYAQFEHRAHAGTGKVYWKATKTLTDPSTFILAYRQMQLA